MKTLSFLVKPVSAGCQLNCTYCFYKDIAENRSSANYGRMRNEVAVALLEKVFQAADADADILRLSGRRAAACRIALL